jgi:hypothetical protein
MVQVLLRLNAKMNYQVSANDHLYLSGYFGRDKFVSTITGVHSAPASWGNSTATFRWNHSYSRKLSNFSLIYNDYKFDFLERRIISTSGFHQASSWNAKADFVFFIHVA